MVHRPCIVVAGGAGFVGSHFVDAAVARGHRVVVVDKLTYAGRRENVEAALATGRADLRVLDVCDREAIDALLARKRPRAIVNFAAESHVDRSIEAPPAFIRTNILGTFTLVSAALAYWQGASDDERRAFRYLQVSTDEVFGALGATGKFTEASPKSPSSPYSASKAAADHLVSAWHRTYSLPAIVTYSSNNYGARQHPEKLIPRMITRALEGQDLPVYGDGANVRDWIDVRDHARGLLLALERAAPGSSYAFGGDAEVANIDVVRRICRALDARRPRGDGRRHEAQIRLVKDRPGHDFRYAIDDARARDELGFARAHAFDAGLDATVDWYLANEAWWRPLLGAGA